MLIAAALSPASEKRILRRGVGILLRFPATPRLRWLRFLQLARRSLAMLGSRGSACSSCGCSHAVSPGILITGGAKREPHDRGLCRGARRRGPRPSIQKATTNTRFFRGFLIARRFTEQESTVIDNALRSPNTFVLDDNGNVRADTKEYENPLAPQRSTLPRSIAQLESNNAFFTHDSKHVISANLRWMLLRDNARWFLVVNALHTKAFREFYEHEIQNNRTTQEHGATTSSSTSNVLIRGVFQKYAQTLTTNGNAYLDPLTAQFISSEACAISSWFHACSKTSTCSQDRAARRSSVLWIPTALCSTRFRRPSRERRGACACAKETPRIIARRSCRGVTAS